MEANELKYDDLVSIINEFQYCRYSKDNLCLHENIDGNFQLNLGSMHLNLNFVHQLQHLLWVLDKGDIEL